MDNNAYSQPRCKPCPYIVNVKEFRMAILCLPLEGTVAYRLPYGESNAVYTFPAPFSTDRYPITQLVFCDYDYWVVIPNLGNNFATGYVRCSDLGFDYEKYVDPDQQTPNSQIGTNTDVIFNMWYFPNNKYKGVNYATPLYYQFYNGGTDSRKCTLLSSISGLYKYKGIYLDPPLLT